MEPIIGTGLILALIPLFQRERDKTAQTNKENFYQWLIEHKFQEVKDCITNNFELSLEIEKLLKLNQEELICRFDEVDQKLLCILNSVQEFRGLTQAVAPRACLSEQEESIIRQFVDSEAPQLYDMTHMDGTCWLAGSKEIDFKDKRTITASFNNLCLKGFLVKGASSKGKFYYELTEQAIDYVESLKKSGLSDQAKSILKQYIESQQQYLCIMPLNQGAIAVMAQNVEIEISSQRFVNDDINELEKRKLIQFDGKMGGNGKRYTLTRAGNEYARSLSLT